MKLGEGKYFLDKTRRPKSAAIPRVDMLKRRRVEEEDPAPVRKKRRLRSYYDLSLLSDELILKVLTYLPISDLAICQRCV